MATKEKDPPSGAQIRANSRQANGNVIHPVDIETQKPQVSTPTPVVYQEIKHFKKWFPWLIPCFVLANIIMFVITMYVNNCPKNSVSCIATFLGRFSFQPFKENPLLGPSSIALQKMGALDVGKVIDQDQGWRLITCNWLHGGVFHILANMLSLLVIGIRLEQEFGFGMYFNFNKYAYFFWVIMSDILKNRYVHVIRLLFDSFLSILATSLLAIIDKFAMSLAIRHLYVIFEYMTHLRIGLLYVISGFGGSLLSALFLQSNISVGASGALFGLLGGMLSELITNWTMYDNKIAAFVTLVVIVAVNLAVGILPHVDNFAHIGGFATGFLLGFVFLIRPQLGWVTQRYAPPGYSASSSHKFKMYQCVLWIVSLILVIVG
ncbi:hypothetical protein Patl1_31856 [Pistacia atlantica]|uniref:Uncharacterized protein n=1 Tax=Pistacia atlantica TaxID=434234 RepID=A0ACC1ARI7_9ROSI|nr:hypothetical protein Patl1_31856 [Pistacia atlantica]